jgi:hypothetical protein
LKFLADRALCGEADQLKEYTIGLDVFDKSGDYDPRKDATVRLHVSRLRQKLADYYRTEGQNDSILVSLPKGHFKLVWEPRPISIDLRPKDEPAGSPAPAKEFAFGKSLYGDDLASPCRPELPITCGACIPRLGSMHSR